MAQNEPNRNQIEWSDAKGRICVEMLAKGLNLGEGPVEGSWSFHGDALKSGERIEVAELLEVSKLQVKGVYDTSKLTRNTKYEVLFDIKMNSSAFGFELPVTFSLTAGQTTKEKNKLLNKLINEFSWVEVPVDQFNTGEYGIDNIKFKMFHPGDHRKKGIVVRGVIIRAV